MYTQEPSNRELFAVRSNDFLSAGFQREYQCEPFAVDPLMVYGLRYHRECEDHDARVCSRKNHRGFGVPEGREHSIVNLHATIVRRRLANELIEAGLASDDNAIERMRDAIAMAGEPFRKEWDRDRDRERSGR